MNKFDALYNKIIAEAETMGSAPKDDEKITITVEGSTPDDLDEEKERFEKTYGINAEHSPGFNAAVIEWTITGPLKNVRKFIIDEFNFGDDQIISPEMEVYLEDDEPDLEEWKKIFAGMKSKD